MKKIHKKKRVRYDRLLVCLAVLILVCFIVIKCVSFVVTATGSLIKSSETVYISSITNNVKLYDETYEETSSIPRGTEVKKIGGKIVQKDENDTVVDTYVTISYDNKKYLIKESDYASKLEDAVKEKTMYVRTPLTIYKSLESSEILSFAKKGTSLEITGFDKINSDGSINKYKIKVNDSEGYIYAKYTLYEEEEAKKYYDYNGAYEIHAARGNRFGGGDAGTLDYYPVAKPNFNDNTMPKEVRSLYLNAGVLGNIDEYIKVAKNGNINAFVVDIKDNTSPGYPAKAMEKYSPTNYKKALNSYEGYKAAIKKLKDAGFYVIGRITTFKDSFYVTDNPSSAITSTSNGTPYKHNGSYWPSVYSRDVWEFTVELAKESVTEMGFNEIQFDYVRFPDRTGSIESAGLVNMNNKYNESKASAIQAFLMYACDEIHKENAYVSVDVFGESANTYVAAYGQYWAAISNIVDVISGMPYPDHFSDGEYGISTPWTNPYKILNVWGSSVAKRQTEIETPAVVRTWIQAYNAIRSPYNVYDEEAVSNEIKGLYDAGLTGGYMTWNGSSNISKYKEIINAFRKDYTA